MNVFAKQPHTIVCLPARLSVLHVCGRGSCMFCMYMGGLSSANSDLRDVSACDWKQVYGWSHYVWVLAL